MTPLRQPAHRGGLLVIDMQEKLLRRMPRAALITANTRRLIQAANLLEMPVWATEQYPEGLGPTVPELLEKLPRRERKTSFSCCAVGPLLEQFHGLGLRHLTLTGVEAHVCVLQTALDLIGLGLTVQVPVDAVDSRHDLDRDVALQRLARAGAVLTTTETALFEWIGTADHAAFRAISDLVKNFVAPTS